MNQIKNNILIINGSLGGANGNTNVLIEKACQYLGQNQINFEILHLEEYLKKNQNDLLFKISWADGFIFTTGTYWDSWGSPMQIFLELITQYEASEAFLYKPASVMVSMHSVGGKAVLSRLQGVLNTIGISIPPMSGLVYALTTHLAMAENKEHSEFQEDFWSQDDIEIIIHNLITAVRHQQNFKSWPVDRKDPKRRWL